MHVFVTGATGGVGSAVVKDLIAHGDRVTGLSRAAEKGTALAENGATVLHGTIDDLDILRDAAASADAVIHTAFVAADMPPSTARTREVLGWVPTGPDLLTNIDHAGYYSA